MMVHGLSTPSCIYLGHLGSNILIIDEEGMVPRVSSYKVPDVALCHMWF